MQTVIVTSRNKFGYQEDQLELNGAISFSVGDDRHSVSYDITVDDLVALLKKHFRNPLSSQRKAELRGSFCSFYDRYGKKVGKEAAFKSWCKLTDTERSEVLHRVDKFVRHHRDIKYRPFPATFLNGKRWEDELAEDIKPKPRVAWAQENNWGQ